MKTNSTIAKMKNGDRIKAAETKTKGETERDRETGVVAEIKTERVVARSLKPIQRQRYRQTNKQIYEDRRRGRQAGSHTERLTNRILETPFSSVGPSGTSVGLSQGHCA